MATSEPVAGYVDRPGITPETIERRAYQLELAAVAAETHTLVCLPTGLGKTTVSLLVTAARLHTHGGKSLMLAPTRPLVEQHAAFYREALTIDDDEVVVFTGDVSPADRASYWETATVIVATPQVIENDLIGGRVELDEVVHLTFDECHRASGSYPYTFIAERYHATADRPLVTGMSASPGDDKEAILQVCENLGIDEIAVKTDEDADVDAYTYDTEVEWETLELPDEIVAIRDEISAVIEERLEELKRLGVAGATDPAVSQRDLNRMRGKLQSMIDGGNQDGYRGMSLHAEVMKLKRALEIAETQSVAAVSRYFERQREDARSAGASKATQRLVSDPRIKRAIDRAAAFDGTHPKFSRARIRIAQTLGIEGGDRVIVFTESRDTAEVLTEFLDQSFDARRFVGQNDREGSDGMTQREQRDVLDAFRANEFDVLVSTSVAEEGLDVPEVDLVLFFEPVPTAIRAIQRRGRTGRHAPGKVVVLLAEDTRDEAYFWISRRREREMADELRTLKAMETDIEAALEDNSPTTETKSAREETQPSLAAFDAADDDRDEPAEADESPTDDEAVVASAGGGEEIEIVADQRELDATIGRELSRRDGVSVRLETLAVGDYVLSDRVVIERKTVEDFLDTLLGEDRSLFTQIRAMVEHYDRPVVLVEGDDLLGQRDVHPNAIRGALASLVVDFGVSVLFTADQTDTTELLAIIADREQRERNRSPSVHGEKGGRTLAEQQEYLLAAITDVGIVTARSLLEAFDTVENVMTADETALCDVEGIGEVTAARIREVVTAPYEPS